MAIHDFKKPYLLLIGDMENPNNAKTAFGLRDWTPEACIGQLRFGDKAVDIGLPETLGLLHGSQPDALVLCHDPTRKALNGFPHMPVLTPKRALAPYLKAARLTNPKARFVGISLNTSRLSQAEALAIMHDTTQSLGMPCVDPIRTGVESIVAALESFYAQ